MSKAVGTFVQKALVYKNGAKKFSPNAQPGRRILPSKTKDKDFELRIDAGHYDDTTKLLNVVLQVNAEASTKGLKAFVSKNDTHGKLATAQFDTGAADQEAEFKRVLEDLEKGAKEKLKSLTDQG